MAEDVKVEHVFYTRCRADIQKYSCLGGSNTEPDTKRAHVLLCLESAHMDGMYRGDSMVLCVCVCLWAWVHACSQIFVCVIC